MILTFQSKLFLKGKKFLLFFSLDERSKYACFSHYIWIWFLLKEFEYIWVILIKPGVCALSWSQTLQELTVKDISLTPKALNNGLQKLRLYLLCIAILYVAYHRANFLKVLFIPPSISPSFRLMLPENRVCFLVDVKPNDTTKSKSRRRKDFITCNKKGEHQRYFPKQCLSKKQN